MSENHFVLKKRRGWERLARRRRVVGRQPPRLRLRSRSEKKAAFADLLSLEVFRERKECKFFFFFFVKSLFKLPYSSRSGLSFKPNEFLNRPQFWVVRSWIFNLLAVMSSSGVRSEPSDSLDGPDLSSLSPLFSLLSPFLFKKKLYCFTKYTTIFNSTPLFP